MDNSVGGFRMHRLKNGIHARGRHTEWLLPTLACVLVNSPGCLAKSVGSERQSKPVPKQTSSTPHIDMRVLPEMNYSRKYLEKIIREESLLLSQEPDNAHAYEVRGLASWKLEDFASATRDLEKSLALAPKDASAFLFRALAECYAEDNQHLKAVDYFTRCMQRWPYAICPLPSVVYVHRSESYAQLHKLPQALADADKIVAANKDQHWAYDFRARLNWNMGQYRRVVDDCTAAIRLAPMDTASYVQRAKAYEKLGQTKLAERDKKTINELARTVDQ